MRLSEILKSGETRATDVTLNGTLSPAQGKAFGEAIVLNNDFLKRITTDITGRLTKTRTAIDASKGMLTRHISGKKTTENKKLGVVGCTLNMVNGVKLTASITDEALDDNQDNANFEAEQFEGFAKVFANDLLYLGLAGTADNVAETAPFLELAKGWIQIARESADTKKTTYVYDATQKAKSVVDGLNALCAIADSNISDTMSILLSKRDYQLYVDYISQEHQNSVVFITGIAKQYKGRELIPLANMPDGVYLGSPIKNFVLGMARDVQRTRWYDNDESALKYKFVVRPDFEFDIKKFVAIAQKAI
jgi:hypothetical protein